MELSEQNRLLHLGCVAEYIGFEKDDFESICFTRHFLPATTIDGIYARWAENDLIEWRNAFISSAIEALLDGKFEITHP